MLFSVKTRNFYPELSGKYTVGILGGSFDPPHKAHIELAKAAFAQCGLNRLLFVPARQAALKTNVACATGRQRAEMLRICAEKLDFDWRIEPFELSREGVSYSIDTARYLAEKYPNADLVWIIGSDHIGKLSAWRDIESLCKIVRFACAGRPRCPLKDGSLPKNARIDFLDFAPMDVSSTSIRADIAAGNDTRAALDSDVISYIKTNKLYQ